MESRPDAELAMTINGNLYAAIRTGYSMMHHVSWLSRDSPSEARKGKMLKKNKADMVSWLDI